MRQIAYLHVKSVHEAVAAIRSNPEAAFLAGGTTAVDLLKEGVWNPGLLIDINALPLTRVEAGDDAVHIGAMVRNSDLAWNETIRTRFPVLSEALLSGASAQIRNMATVGGNLLQRTRCPYFRDLAMPCNKREPGSGCSALDGYNRPHAVMGVSERCIATHPSDMAVALIALDATVRVSSPSGDREIPLMQFYLEPGETPERETVLAHDDLIVGISIPGAPSWTKSTYLKVRDRESYEFALASAAVAVRMDGGKLAAVRVALGGIGTKPWRAPEAEQALVGQVPSEVAFKRAAAIAVQGAKPRRDNAFKVELAKRTMVRALMTVTEVA